MKNEEKTNEIVMTMKNEANDLDFCFDAATENAVRFACGWMAEWKDQQFAIEKKAVIGNACEWLSKQLYTDDGGCLASEWYQQLGNFLEAFRKAMEDTK